jgi:hypothetical protein
MTDYKTHASASLNSDNPASPSKGGLSAKPIAASHTAAAEPRLDSRFHRTFQSCRRGSRMRAVIVLVSEANEAGN